MVTPELKNYVSQARMAGSSDEQIRQSLMQQGWGEGDINEAMGLGSASGAPQPAAAAPSSSSRSVRTAAIIAGVVLVLGVGGYFAYAQWFSGKPASEKPSAVFSQRSDKEIDCEKLLPWSDFERITGMAAADYRVAMETDDLNKYHEGGDTDTVSSAAELMPGGGPSEGDYAPGARTISCLYKKKVQDEQARTYEEMGLGFGNSDLTLMFITSDLDTEAQFKQAMETQLALNGTTQEFAGQSVQIPQDSTVVVEGVGAGAYASNGSVTFLDRGKKYHVSVLPSYLPWDKQDMSMAVSIEIAKVIDANMR